MSLDAHPGEESQLDLATLQSLFGDEDDVIREILETYVDDLQKNSAELRGARAAEDRKRLGRVAHSMKGASGNVGANAFAAMCATLERRSAEGSWEELDGLSEAVLTAALALVDNVQIQVRSLSGG